MGSPPVSKSSGSCFGASLFVLLILGVMAFFPWARQTAITVYPNLNGVSVSLAFAALTGLLLAIALKIARPALKLLALLVLASGVLLAAILIYLVLQFIWKWLMIPY